MLKRNLLSSVLLLWPSLLLAQVPAVPDLATAGPPDLAWVLLDEPGDGNIWALTPTAKLRLGRDAVDYVPYLGQRAPKNHPLQLRLASAARGSELLPIADAAAPVRDGDQVTFSRVGLTERWDVTMMATEQSFVLDLAPGSGDLVLTIAFATDMTAATDAAGIVFTAPGLGNVRYGNLTVRDAAGRSWCGPSLLRDGVIELRVADAWLRTATFPIVVDPLLSTFAVDSASASTRLSDVAYDATNDRWLVVYERVFSQFDIDVVARRYSGVGNFIDEVAVATGTRESRFPSVANNEQDQRFLIVWDEDQGIADRVVLGRFRDAVSTNQLATFTIVDAPNGENRNAHVGGSQHGDTLSSTYQVVCEETQGSEVHSIGVLVLDTGFIIGTNLVVGSATVSSVEPSVSKQRSPGEAWMLVWRDIGPTGATSGVRCAFQHPFRNSIINHPGFLLPGSGLARPAVASFGIDHVLVADGAASGTARHVFGCHVTFRSLVFTNITGTVDLTATEPIQTLGASQFDAAVGFDGQRFTYAYVEQVGTTQQTFAATRNLDMSSVESHVFVGTSTTREIEPRLTSRAESGGNPGRHFICWSRQSAGVSHVHGALCNGIAPGNTVVRLPTGCGSLFTPDISLSDIPTLGADVTVATTRIQPTSQFVLVGLPRGLPLTLCGNACKLGIDPITSVVAGPDLHFVIPVNQALVGFSIAVQGALLGVAGGCTATAFGVPLIVTDTLRITIR